MARPKLKRPIYRTALNSRGYYEIHWTEDGKTRRKSCRTRDAQEAEIWCDQFIAAREIITVDENTVSAICDAYYQSRSTQLVRPDNLKFSLARVKEHIGNLPPSLISQATINGYLMKRKGRANDTIIRELKCFRAALRWALGDQAPRFIMPLSHSPARDRWLTKEEARKLVDAASAPHIALFIELALGSAHRSNAILELNWLGVSEDRIDFGENVGKKRRGVVPINNQLRRALTKAAKIRTSDFVIEYQGKGLKSVRTGLNAAHSRAGLGTSGTHVLRHSAATWMVADGRPFEEIAKYLNTTVAMIEKVYGHHAPDFLKTASNALMF